VFRLLTVIEKLSNAPFLFLFASTLPSGEGEQGDQIGRIFAYFATFRLLGDFKLLSVFYYKSSQNFALLFTAVKVIYSM
jgi:hypothetical protein